LELPVQSKGTKTQEMRIRS